MSDIKVGDLVIVVKPSLCCGSTRSIGHVFKVFTKDDPTIISCRCGHLSRNDDSWVMLQNGKYAERVRLKKIDPPSTGDSLPTRASLDQPIKDVIHQ